MPLTDIKIRQTKATDKPVKLLDGAGLYLEIKPNGSKLWRYRYKIDGKENLFAVGEYPQVTLQEARKAREEARELVKQGLHPSHIRKAAKDKQIGENANTFRAVANEWLDKKRKNITPYYIKQIETSLQNDVFPFVGRLPLRQITAPQILAILNRVADRGAATVALNIRQWCSAIFRYGVATLRADYDPVAALRGSIVRSAVQNAEAMSIEDIKQLMAKLEHYGGLRTTLLAIRLMLYTFVRTVEMRRGEWSEVNFDSALWVIPADKMKKGRTHMIPLSRQAINVLLELKTITGGGANMFPNSRRPNEVMSATTINRAMEYLGVPFTGHDFRATASTHLYEIGFESHLVEMQLAHAETNKTKAAYNHAQYLPQRKQMMQAWADWLDALFADEGVNGNNSDQ